VALMRYGSTTSLSAEAHDCGAQAANIYASALRRDPVSPSPVLDRLRQVPAFAVARLLVARTRNSYEGIDATIRISAFARASPRLCFATVDLAAPDIR
jgi:hypothetical protein